MSHLPAGDCSIWRLFGGEQAQDDCPPAQLGPLCDGLPLSRRLQGTPVQGVEGLRRGLINALVEVHRRPDGRVPKPNLNGLRVHAELETWIETAL